MSEKTQDVIEPQRSRLQLDRIVVQTALVLLVLFGASVTLFWRLGVFDSGTHASNAQVVAAALALVGVLVAAALTFVGVILKHSLDLRTEGRLRLETSIQAVELLTENGKPATQTRQAGALFVLANLNQLDFAYALLGQVWANRDISPGAAVWVVNRLLLYGDPPLQHDAAALLDVNADTLAKRDGYEFPTCVDLRWPNTISRTAREYLLSAFVKGVLSRKRREWDDGSLNAFVAQLDIVRRKDDADYIRNGALLCLDALLDAHVVGPGDVLYPPGEQIDITKLLAAVKAAVPKISPDAVLASHLDLAERLREWGKPPAAEPEAAEAAELRG